jgi:PD-(D/E)XK nuclease superfamily
MAEYKKQYNPNRSSEWNYGGAKWRLSRSKIDFFIECPRCFYLDNKLGTKRPSFPSFNLNIAVDELFKKEFDTYRTAQTKHPLFTKYELDFVPFAHPSLNAWRDPFVGIEFKEPTTNLMISGGVDDIWQNTSGSLVIADYKATAKDGSITALSDSPWDQQYKRQLGVYRWLLENNGFTVAETGYLVYANGLKTEATFSDRLVFETTLVPVSTDTSWIVPTLEKIKTCLDASTLPAIGQDCEFCPYREACGKKLQAIHHATKKST